MRDIMMIIKFKADLGEVDGVSDAHHAAISILKQKLEEEDESIFAEICIGNIRHIFDDGIDDPINWPI